MADGDLAVVAGEQVEPERADRAAGSSRSPDRDGSRRARNGDDHEDARSSEDRHGRATVRPVRRRSPPVRTASRRSYPGHLLRAEQPLRPDQQDQQDQDEHRAAAATCSTKSTYGREHLGDHADDRVHPRPRRPTSRSRRASSAGQRVDEHSSMRLVSIPRSGAAKVPATRTDATASPQPIISIRVDRARRPAPTDSGFDAAAPHRQADPGAGRTGRRSAPRRPARRARRASATRRATPHRSGRCPSRTASGTPRCRSPR